MDEASDLSHRFQAESVARTLEIIGDRWSLLVLREAFFGVRRYGQLARNLAIPRPTLSARLKRLVDDCLLERVLYAVDPDRYEYRLTEAGRDLFAAILTLMQWGDRHIPYPEGPPIVFRHQQCGELATPHLVCDHCAGEITARNVTPERGPGFWRTKPDSSGKRARCTAQTGWLKACDDTP
ncbi:putative HTH-type transcriptional regulator [Mycobacterium saskatchewanense]|nr:putative HTH-type transcriptional regulator [Mycobacterium saskatchewanense]